MIGKGMKSSNNKRKGSYLHILSSRRDQANIIEEGQVFVGLKALMFLARGKVVEEPKVRPSHV